MAKASLATATRLATLGRRTFTETFAATNTPENLAAYLAEAYGPEVQLAQLQDPATTCLLAEMQGQTVGYALLTENSPWAYPRQNRREAAGNQAALRAGRLDWHWSGQGPHAAGTGSGPSRRLHRRGAGRVGAQ
ncbi:MAG: hypothetical protein WKG07_44910 [Hymenobacter sp.]